LEFPEPYEGVEYDWAVDIVIDSIIMVDVDSIIMVDVESIIMVDVESIIMVSELLFSFMLLSPPYDPEEP
jgi:hypothetical protein